MVTEVKQAIEDGEVDRRAARVCEVFHRAVELIGKRWTGAVIQAMLEGAARYCEIKAAVRGLSDRLLAERLRELEEAGIVFREVTAERPPQVSYRLTEKGRGLKPALDAVADWAHRWQADAEAVPK